MNVRKSEELGVIYMARHGETAWSRTGRHTGLTDLPLTEQGERNAGRLGERLRGLTFAKVFTSHLRRATRTSELAGFGSVAEIDPDLVEWDYGNYDGGATAEIRAERPDWSLFRDGCLGDESPRQIAARADRDDRFRLKDVDPSATPQAAPCRHSSFIVLNVRVIGLRRGKPFDSPARTRAFGRWSNGDRDSHCSRGSAIGTARKRLAGLCGRPSIGRLFLSFRYATGQAIPRSRRGFPTIFFGSTIRSNSSAMTKHPFIAASRKVVFCFSARWAIAIY